MALNEDFCSRLVCPETKAGVRLAEEDLLTRLNDEIEAGSLKNASGETVDQKLDGGFVRDDGKFLYPVWDDIPVMLISERIPIAD